MAGSPAKKQNGNGANLGFEAQLWATADKHGRIPKYASSFEDMLNIFYYQVGVDGVFTDFPDRVVDFLRRTKYQRKGY